MCPGDTTDEVAAWASSLPARDLDRVRFYAHPGVDMGEALAAWVEADLPLVLSDLDSPALAPLRELIAACRVVDEVAWDTALPLFDVGYPGVVARGDLDRGLADGILLAGDYTWGPHLEGAVGSGIRAARRAAEFLDR